jgi:hypothetical protein
MRESADAAAALLSGAGLRGGARVAITAGSRGIAQIADLTRAVVTRTSALGYEPFIVPAMGSHGGATGAGQRQVLAHYAITEETMGCPIQDDMASVPLGTTSEGVATFMGRIAWEAEAVLVLNRVKPHTDFHGNLESGLAKMIAIGLGKLEGARACHDHVFGIGLGAAIASAAAHILATRKIIGGIAVIENAYHEIAKVVGVPSSHLLAREEALLHEARELVGRLPLDEVDVLICDRMGKNISGQGLDTKVIGRSPFGYVQGQPWRPEMPIVRRIIVRDLSAETDGNAMGMGLIDIVPERFMRKVDMAATLVNSVTARTTENAKRPLTATNDREALEFAMRTIPPRLDGPRLIYVRDTLSLTDALVSEGALSRLAGRDDVTQISSLAPLVFDQAGDLISPFEPGAHPVASVRSTA